MSDYKVELEVYHGPLDLLLFLIRREEVDIYDIPIARILEQFLAYVDLLRVIDADVVGDFLVLAATLMEIKSRMLLPVPPPEEQDEDLSDPRLELVRQLLQYKTYKDAARTLGVAAQLQAMRFSHRPADLPEEPEQLDLEEVQVWDLLNVFRKLLEQTGQRKGWHDVVYDDTPLSLHAADLVDALERAGGSQVFEVIFEGRSKSQMIGLFLALLELIRQRRVRAEQTKPFSVIVLHLIDSTPIDEPVEDEGFMHGEAADANPKVNRAVGVPLDDDEELIDDPLLSSEDDLFASTDRAMDELEEHLNAAQADSKGGFCATSSDDLASSNLELNLPAIGSIIESDSAESLTEPRTPNPEPICHEPPRKTQ